MNLIISLLIAQSIAYSLICVHLYRKGVIDGQKLKNEQPLEVKTVVETITDTFKEVKSTVEEAKAETEARERYEKEQKQEEQWINYNGDEPNVNI